MTVNLSSALDRIVELEIEALAALSTAVTADAVDHFTHTQTYTPYWTNRLGRFTLPAQSNDLDYPEYTVIMRLVIGHVTEDYDGNLENKLYTWVPQIIEYFHQRPGLTTDTQSSGLNDLLWAEISGGTGLAILQNYGSIGSQIGVEFTLTMHFVEEIDLASS